jgi:alpha-tubulin suppressor-like RCC1 family protein
MRRRDALEIIATVVLTATFAGCESPAAPLAFVYADRAVSVPRYSEGWRAVSVGGAHSCGIRIDATLYCWGSNGSGQLGVATARGTCGRTPASCEAAPRAVPIAEPVAQVSAGDRHSCAVAVSGTLRCWGENLQFQTGVEALTYVAMPTVVLADARFLQVASGATHSCALRTNGIVYCWGEGRLGALGRGDTVSSVIPQPIASDRQFTHVSSGRWRSCAVATDATLWCWGSEWESADGNTDYFHERLLPHRIEDIPPTRSVSVAGSSICAVSTDDRALCWESNGFGQLGIGSTQGIATPAFVHADEGLESVTAGIIQTCALARSGRALCWGNDTFGQLGIPRTGERCGELECRRAPASVFGQQRFVGVATGGGSHSCGVTTSSALLCWGLGSEGQLGDGWTRDRQSLPVGVLAPSP